MAGFDNINCDQMWTLKNEAALTLAFLAETASTTIQIDEHVSGVKGAFSHDKCRPSSKRMKAENQEMRATGDFPQKLLEILENSCNAKSSAGNPMKSLSLSMMSKDLFPKFFQSMD